jgi:hypothetical protein
MHEGLRGLRTAATAHIELPGSTILTVKKNKFCIHVSIDETVHYFV